MADTAVPSLPRGVRLSEDQVRQRWVLLAPERILELDEIATSVLKLCDGKRDVAAISGELALAYEADVAEVMSDVKEMLGGLADKRFIVL